VLAKQNLYKIYSALRVGKAKALTLIPFYPYPLSFVSPLPLWGKSPFGVRGERVRAINAPLTPIGGKGGCASYPLGAFAPRGGAFIRGAALTSKG